MNREVHVRVWERAEVKFLRATRRPAGLGKPSMGMKQTLDVLNRMEVEGVIDRYAIGGAVAAYKDAW
jgi:hypothetical protein